MQAMYRNLKAEQARHGHTDEFVAKSLNMTRTNFANKMETGRFRVHEVKQLCNMYSCSFEYLFATEGE